VIRHPRDFSSETWHLAADIGVYAWYYTPRFCAALPGARKFRLFLVACYRAVWEFVPRAEFRAAIEAGESFADDGDVAAATTATDAAWDVVSVELSPWYSLGWDLTALPMDDLFEGGHFPVWQRIAQSLEKTELNATFGRTQEQAAGLHLRLFRDIFGNPFRPIAFAPEWRTSTAVSLARTMYESREFGAMPILADALQDAGCDNDDILDHCRDTSLTHVRGCWVCDLVLGKA
jgi:hypothetical protein